MVNNVNFKGKKYRIFSYLRYVDAMLVFEHFAKNYEADFDELCCEAYYNNGSRQSSRKIKLETIDVQDGRPYIYGSIFITMGVEYTPAGRPGDIYTVGIYAEDPIMSVMTAFREGDIERIKLCLDTHIDEDNISVSGHRIL